MRVIHRKIGSDIKSGTGSLSARPPELLLTPLARAEPVYPSEVPTRELTDAEIDALPPELPAAGLPRKRILPAPSKPVLKRL